MSFFVFVVVNECHATRSTSRGGEVNRGLKERRYYQILSHFSSKAAKATVSVKVCGCTSMLLLLLCTKKV